MRTYGSILVSILWRVAQIPTPLPSAKRQRGRHETSSDKLFGKARIVMLTRRLSTAYALLNLLAQNTPVAVLRNNSILIALDDHLRSKDNSQGSPPCCRGTL